MSDISSSNSATSASGKTIPLLARVSVSLRAGIVLALANIVCVLIFSWAWVHTRAQPKTILVTGSAKKAIQSDLIIWRGVISATDPKLEVAYATLKTSLTKTMAFLNAQKIPASQITIGSINILKHFEHDAKGNDTDKLSSYELSQSIEISSGDIPRVELVSRTVTGLIEQGVLMDSESPRYLYTHLADLKIVMLAEATKDATARAQQIASNSNAALGPIIDARMGVMQINAVHSDDVSGSGINDTTSREKEITAVLTAHFGLK